MKDKFQLFILLIIVLFCFSCNSSSKGVEMASKDDSAHADYQKYCEGCHGKNLEKFKATDWNEAASTTRMTNAIRYGISSEGMPGYDTTFSKQQIEKLVTYLKKRRSSNEIVTVVDNGKSLIYTTEDYEVKAVLIADNLEIPWSMLMLPSGEILFTEKKGLLKKLLPNGSIESISGVPKVRNRGQGGLLDVKLHPNFATNQTIYLSFSKPSANEGEDLGTTAVIMAKLVGNELQGVKEIFEAKPYVRASHHYAGRMLFDKKGFLFVSVGDRGNENAHPQFLTNHNGKVHRINADGTIPSDNPFTKNTNAVSSIYSYGHRNPQGLALGSDGTIWENEHGPQGGDEINKILPAQNYGWPLVTFGINYNGTPITKNISLPGMMDPIKHWTPSIAPSSMCFVEGNAYSKWKGNLLSASLKFDYIARSVLSGDKVIKEEKILEGIGRIRNVEELSDGKIYVTVENPGRIYRLDVREK
jgi:glucose/arabinose dehydrogenase